eukprot:gnl/MRDRNA2_/MRDRNA2_71877_c0_seq1.p1 gnl/MRDRNA2_/MRDRNA2_71877_c0~~gnl/MRDRNA2_/MRDRNA2_71877_c0_seq1.p1  ORF type:complete len:131 (-),score=5.34 gnl/MRDRNA2_/MRDRNA2_71877_c0_seq1:181-573(-)
MILRISCGHACSERRRFDMCSNTSASLFAPDATIEFRNSAAVIFAEGFPTSIFSQVPGQSNHVEAYMAANTGFERTDKAWSKAVFESFEQNIFRCHSQSRKGRSLAPRPKLLCGSEARHAPHSHAWASTN